MLTKMDIQIIKMWNKKQKDVAETISIRQSNVSWKKKELRRKIRQIYTDYNTLKKMGVIDNEGHILDSYCDNND